MPIQDVLMTRGGKTSVLAAGTHAWAMVQREPLERHLFFSEEEAPKWKRNPARAQLEKPMRTVACEATDLVHHAPHPVKTRRDISAQRDGARPRRGTLEVLEVHTLLLATWHRQEHLRLELALCRIRPDECLEDGRRRGLEMFSLEQSLVLRLPLGVLLLLLLVER